MESDELNLSITADSSYVIFKWNQVKFI